MKENIINHIALVLDASSSMKQGRADEALIKVADNQIAYLAQRSKELDQETRITVYSFADDVKCLIYDKDVLRMPSIAGIYHADGMTALIKATIQSLDDFQQVFTKYGDHSFLIYVLTDGAENSSGIPPATLEKRIKELAENWTLATFVPNQVGVSEAKRFGFPAQNISVWDTSSVLGIENAGKVMREATEQFMQGRAKGVKGSKNLFTFDTSGVADLNARTAAAKGLEKLHPGQYRLLPVTIDSRIDEFVETATKRAYRMGEAFYQLMKPEKIQAKKDIAIFNPKDHSVYRGKNARTLLGLPDFEVKVNPAQASGFEIYVQSTSVNRKLLANTKLLILS